MRITTGSLLTLAVTLGYSLTSHANPFLDNTSKGVYGKDDRADYHQVNRAGKRLADVTVALMPSVAVKRSSNGFQLTDAARQPIAFGRERYPLCRGERFADQPSPAFCSGSIIGDRYVLTAGHCLTTSVNPDTPNNKGYSCDDVAIVTNFETKSNGQVTTSFSKNSVYQCKKVLGTELSDSNGADWLILEVDRPFKNRNNANIRTQGTISNGEGIAVTGHPSGLPKKIALAGSVKHHDNPVFFTSDVDTFGGNSGSPIFNLESAKNGQPIIEGVLVRGAKDYEFNREEQCFNTYTCGSYSESNRNCGGEHVTKISHILKAWDRTGSSIQPFASLVASSPEPAPTPNQPTGISSDQEARDALINIMGR